jgi:TolB-like protein
MPDLSGTAISDQVRQICESDRFRGAPQLAALLRALGEDFGRDDGETAAPGHLGQRPSRLPPEFDPSQSPRVRVQATRLRQALAAYYRGPGASDRVVIDLPRRSYRLRVRLRGRQSHVSHFRAVERATVLVIEVAGYGLDAARDWIPQAVSQQLLVEFGRFTGVHAVGPIRRGDVTTDEGMSLAISQPHPESFLLDASIQADADHMVMTARLLDGATGVQIWSWSAPLDVAKATGLAALAETAAVLTRQLADETGVIAQEILRASAGKPVDQLTVHEAVAAVWRFWITGLADNRAYAMQALENVVAAVPHSGIALAYLATTRCEEFFASQTSALTLSSDVLEMFERARSLDPGNPWVELLRCYGLLFARKTAAIDPVISSLKFVPASGSFSGMLGGILLALDDLAEARRFLARGLVDAPHQPYWCRVGMVAIDLACGDAAAADRTLEQIPTRVDPVVQTLRAAVACRSGDLTAAREFADETLDLCEEFPRFGEIMMRRIFPDRVVDAVARALEPLALGWFHEPSAEARGEGPPESYRSS